MTTGTDSPRSAGRASVGPVQRAVEEKLRTAFDPEILAVENESSSHSVPPGSESHLRVLLVAEAFGGVNRLARHRAVHRALAKELSGPLHALAIEAWTPEEWRDREGERGTSPECRGGSKRG